MQNFTTLQILLQEVFKSEGAERRCDIKAAEDYILLFADQIRDKRAMPRAAVVPENSPSLTVTDNRVTVTLLRDGREQSRTFPLMGFYIYRTNETAADRVTPRPGKDGYTWFMRNYSLADNGDLEIFSEVLEPFEGPILHKLLKG